MTYSASFAEQPSWYGSLDSGEKVLWQGRPSARLRMEFRNPFEFIFALFFLGFSIFWMFGASQAGGFFWTFGLLFFFVGLYQLVGIHFWRAFVRGRTHYTLTTNRAIIASRTYAGRELRSYPLNASTTVTFVDGPLGSIFFAEEWSGYGNRSQKREIGFELIESARQVYETLRRVQKGEN